MKSNLAVIALQILLPIATALVRPSLYASNLETSTPFGVSETRRAWLQKTTAGVIASSVSLFPTSSKAEKFQLYQNEILGFQILIPAAWEKVVEQLPDRRSITLFIDPTSGVDKTLLFIAKTPIQPDFTSLGSFGSVDQVAQTTILPKGELQGTQTKSVMLSSVSKNNAYYFDYKVTPIDLPETHYRVIFTLSNSVLVTLTLQTPESRYASLKDDFDQIIESFGKYDGQ